MPSARSRSTDMACAACWRMVEGRGRMGGPVGRSGASKGVVDGSSGMEERREWVAEEDEEGGTIAATGCLVSRAGVPPLLAG